MDPEREIDRHRRALFAVLMRLVAVVGLPSAPVASLQRHIYFAVLRVLKPAEAALRRMIFVVARGLSVVLRPARSGAATKPWGTVGGVPHFQLLDPRKRFDFEGKPRLDTPRRAGLAPFNLSRFDPATMCDPLSMLRPTDKCSEAVLSFDPAPETGPMASVSLLPASDTPINAKRLRLRLLSLWEALDDLPTQAQRMARAVARHEKRPLRPGLPPGYRIKPRHEAERILTLCHSLARPMKAKPLTHHRARIP